MIVADNCAISLDDNEHNDMLSILRAHHGTIINHIQKIASREYFGTVNIWLHKQNGLMVSAGIQR